MGRIERVPLIPKKNNKKERAREDIREDEKKNVFVVVYVCEDKYLSSAGCRLNFNDHYSLRIGFLAYLHSDNSLPHQCLLSIIEH